MIINERALAALYGNYLHNTGDPTSLMEFPCINLSTPAQYAPASHIGHGREEEYITAPSRLRDPIRLAASLMAAI